MEKNEPPRIDPEASYDERKKQLKEWAKEHKQRKEIDHSEMLSAIESGDEALNVESYEEVTIGEVQATVKAWMPGDAIDAVEQASRLSQREQLQDTLESVHTMLEALTVITEELDHLESEEVYTDKEKIRDFYKHYWKTYGVEGLQAISDTMLDPATETHQRERDSMNGFRTDKQGNIVRSGDGNDGPTPE